jgi:glycosyltransferase domain-containing protein
MAKHALSPDTLAPKVTVLCPLKDRPEHFRRFLICLELVRWHEPIIFLDGSKNDACESIWSNERAHTDFSQVEYIRFPEDAGWPQFLNKMLAALKRVRTEFVHITSDDDMPSENSLLMACELMSARSDVSHVSGRVVDFEVRGRKADAYPDVYGNFVLEKRHLDCSGRYSEAESVQDDTPLLRLERRSRTWPYEGVWRTEYLNEAFSIAQRARVSTYRTLLPIMRTVVLSRGKLIHQGHVFTLRQDNTRNSDGAAMIAAHPTRLDFFTSPETAVERQNVTSELLKLALVQHGELVDAIAVAGWQFHDVLEELKKCATLPDQGSCSADHAVAVLLLRLKTRLRQKINRVRARIEVPLRESLDENKDIRAWSLDSWYPGDKQLVAAVSASVQSFGRRDDARSAFRSWQDLL